MSDYCVTLICCAPWGRGQKHFYVFRIQFGHAEMLYEIYLRRHSMLSKGTRVTRHVS